MKTHFASALLFFSLALQAQPFGGTIFMDPDITTSTDPSAVLSTTYTGRGNVVMYDRRIPDWVTVNAYLFTVVFDDSLTTVAQVNPEFGTVAAATVEAEKYAFLVGQLPQCLRVDVDEIWIHKGTQPFGGGNRSILIHTGQSVSYENDGIIEETLIHEACHTSLDDAHAAHPDWLNAQTLDGAFISTYAQDNPTREDIAESYLTWLAVRYRAANISTADYDTIIATISNRLAYFDSMACNLYPFHGVLSVEEQNAEMRFYPNPVEDYVSFDAQAVSLQNIRLFNAMGQEVTQKVDVDYDRLFLGRLETGFYTLHTSKQVFRLFKK